MDNDNVLEAIFMLRIVRIFRVFHLVKHYRALQILMHAIKASVQELLMLAIFLLLAMVIFSTLVFYAERSLGDDTDFRTIPAGRTRTLTTSCSCSCSSCSCSYSCSSLADDI